MDLKYIIAVADNITDLTAEVNRQIKNGYIPIGGVSMSSNDNVLLQALTK